MLKTKQTTHYNLSLAVQAKKPKTIKNKSTVEGYKENYPWVDIHEADGQVRGTCKWCVEYVSDHKKPIGRAKFPTAEGGVITNADDLNQHQKGEM
jgi:hypothetical protein